MVAASCLFRPASDKLTAEMLVLDHIAVAGETLEDAIDHVEKALGVTMEPGGVHVEMGTHNRLLSLGPGLYLEAIAIDPEATHPDRPRWFDLDRFSGAPRLSNWIARSNDLSATLKDAPDGMGVPIGFTRGDFAWSMAVPGNGRLPFDGAAPALIEWETALHPADRLTDVGCRLTELRIGHPRIADLISEFPALSSMAGIVLEDAVSPRLSTTIATPSGSRVLA